VPSRRPRTRSSEMMPDPLNLSIQFSSTMHFIPRTMDHFGLRGSHFNATLRGFASHLVVRPSGCSLMTCPFALSLNRALRKILHSGGSRLTRTAQRQHAAQIMGGMDTFFANASFLVAFGQDFSIEEMLHQPIVQSHSGPSQGEGHRQGQGQGRGHPLGLNLYWQQG